MNIDSAKAREIADIIDAYDADIAKLQEGKRETFEGLRTALADEGYASATIKLDVAALKAAIAKRAKRRKDADAVEERDALVEGYLDAIEAPAPRATYANAHPVPTHEVQ
jgi:uncharacterized protein (UPF0335 family)